MSRSILRRVGGGIAAAALAVTTMAVAGAAPANATGTCTTETTLLANSSGANRTVNSGARLTFTASVAPVSCTGDAPNGFAGKVNIQRSTDGGASWVTLTSSSTPDATYSGPVARSAIYRGYYTGGTVPAPHNDVYEPSTDRISIGTRRTVSVRDRDVRGGVRGIFTIRPAASIRGMVVTFQVLRNGAWRTYTRVRVSSTGVARATFKASRRGIKYRMVLPAGRGMVKSVDGPYVASIR